MMVVTTEIWLTLFGFPSSFWCFSYDDFLELSQRGDNLSVDLTVGDIYGEHGYPKVWFLIFLVPESRDSS